MTYEKKFDLADFDNWLDDVKQALANLSINVDDGEGRDVAVDLYVNDFAPEDAAEEMLRPRRHVDFIQASAASVLLAALMDITLCAEAGAEGANMDLWIEQARDAIAKAKDAGIEVPTP